jgi:O-antigen/teichoic acid export membrane protein
MIGVIIGWSQIGSLGIPQTVMKFVAGSAARGDKEELIEYISSALTINVFSGSIILLILLVISGTLGNMLRVPLTLKPNMPFFIIFSGTIVAVSFLSQTLNSILSGIGRMDIANINEMIGKIIGPIVSITFIYKGYGIIGLLIGGMTECLIILFMATTIGILILGFVPYNIKLVKRRKIREILFFGGTLAVSSFLAMFIEPFNRFVLGQYVGLSSATIYDVASKVVVQTRGIFEAAFRSFLPQSSTYFNIGYVDKLKEMSKLSVRLVCLLGVPLLLTLIIWAPELISIWLKIDMQNISYAVRIIAISYIFSLMVSPSYYLFIGIGKKEICFWVYFILSTLNFILVLLIMFLGLVNFKWVINIFALSLIISSLYLMRASYLEFGERYILEKKNMLVILISIVCISSFKIIGQSYNINNIAVILLILSSLIVHISISYVCNLIPVDYIKSRILLNH